MKEIHELNAEPSSRVLQFPLRRLAEQEFGPSTQFPVDAASAQVEPAAAHWEPRQWSVELIWLETFITVRLELAAHFSSPNGVPMNVEELPPEGTLEKVLIKMRPLLQSAGFELGRITRPVAQSSEFGA